MKTVALEIPVYSYLLDEIAVSGETLSAYLARRLGITVKPEAAAPADTRSEELDAVLKTTAFRNAKGVVGRFLILLGYLHQKHRSDFHKVESIRGSTRLYFSKSERALRDSGNNVNPKKIPGSDYWVITTTPTILKQEMIRAVMFALGYKSEHSRRAEAEIAESSERERFLASL